MWSDHRRIREQSIAPGKEFPCPSAKNRKCCTGQLYHAGCPELQAEQIANKHWMHRYNNSVELLNDARHGLLWSTSRLAKAR
jgi:hypothetical protein